jgi:hypothetical protein
MTLVVASYLGCAPDKMAWYEPACIAVAMADCVSVRTLNYPYRSVEKAIASALRT